MLASKGPSLWQDSPQRLPRAPTSAVRAPSRRLQLRSRGLTGYAATLPSSHPSANQMNPNPPQRRGCDPPMRNSAPHRLGLKQEPSRRWAEHPTAPRTTPAAPSGTASTAKPAALTRRPLAHPNVAINLPLARRPARPPSPPSIIHVNGNAHPHGRRSRRPSYPHK